MTGMSSITTYGNHSMLVHASIKGESFGFQRAEAVGQPRLQSQRRWAHMAWLVQSELALPKAPDPSRMQYNHRESFLPCHRRHSHPRAHLESPASQATYLGPTYPQFWRLGTSCPGTSGCPPWDS